MYLKRTNGLAKSIFLATVLSSGLIASACSAESSYTPILSNQSSPTEVYELGLAYYEGNSVPQDYDKAFVLMQTAAEQGYVEAQFNLGAMYENGIGINQDYKKAMQWYSLAADNGDFDAQNNIGTLYYFGRGVTQDYGKALEWYTKATDQGLDLAQLNISGLYENGYGVPQDYDTAFEWYKKAAGQGNQEASNRIGKLIMDKKIDDPGIILYRTQETGLTLGDIEN